MTKRILYSGVFRTV